MTFPPTTAYCIDCEQFVRNGPLFFGDGDADVGLAFCDCVSVDISGCNEQLFWQRAPDHWEQREPDIQPDYNQTNG